MLQSAFRATPPPLPHEALVHLAHVEPHALPPAKLTSAERRRRYAALREPPPLAKALRPRFHAPSDGSPLGAPMKLPHSGFGSGGQSPPPPFLGVRGSIGAGAAVNGGRDPIDSPTMIPMRRKNPAALLTVLEYAQLPSLIPVTRASDIALARLRLPPRPTGGGGFSGTPISGEHALHQHKQQRSISPPPPHTATGNELASPWPLSRTVTIQEADPLRSDDDDDQDHKLEGGEGLDREKSGSPPQPQPLPSPPPPPLTSSGRGPLIVDGLSTPLQSRAGSARTLHTPGSAQRRRPPPSQVYNVLTTQGWQKKELAHPPGAPRASTLLAATASRVITEVATPSYPGPTLPAMVALPLSRATRIRYTPGIAQTPAHAPTTTPAGAAMAAGAAAAGYPLGPGAAERVGHWSTPMPRTRTRAPPPLPASALPVAGDMSAKEPGARAALVSKLRQAQARVVAREIAAIGGR
ncbi:hypothetical protein BC828DRAFT_405497 [Blastocladiella britannica]|nr:hypothetical protein BC828DRAFT_405497 [Blastocladiella britannica]